jgi:hypothetical protein
MTAMPLTPELLIELELIKRVKYAYLRTLDLKQWDDLASLLTEDVSSSYSDGKYTFEGRDAVMNFLKEGMGSSRIITKHHCHHPEIDFLSPTSAVGLWYLTDLVISEQDPAKPEEPPIVLDGTGIYEDKYRKVDGQWKICHTGYKRVYRQIQDRNRMPILHLKSRFK